MTNERPIPLDKDMVRAILAGTMTQTLRKPRRVPVPGTTGAGRGRPPGPPGSQRTARLVVRVSEAERQAYQAAAKRAGVSVGEWVRTELADAVDDGPRLSESDAP